MKEIAERIEEVRVVIPDSFDLRKNAFPSALPLPFPCRLPVLSFASLRSFHADCYNRQMGHSERFSVAAVMFAMAVAGCSSSGDGCRPPASPTVQGPEILLFQHYDGISVI